MRKITCLHLHILLSLLLFSGHAVAVDSVGLSKKVSGLGVPWGMTFLSNMEALVSERSGALKRIRFSSEAAQVEEIQGLPEIMTTGQGGLLDVRVSPSQSVASNRPLIYFTFVGASSIEGKQNLPTLKLARAELEGLRLVNREILFEANHPQRGGRHFGSRIAFDNKGHVFFSMGDRGERNNSQDLKRHSGSILRLNLDGSIPESNPFVGEKGAMPEIWSFGHRNPQGLMFDQTKNSLWSIEHGPNYGWPTISYGREYVSNMKVSADTFKEGMEQPVHYFTPSIAPGSLLVYSGKKKPEWKGALLSGALKLRHLNAVFVDKDKKFVEEKRFFENDSMRVRNVAESPEGDIFMVTDNGDIFQLIL